jgi:hypothetical protein
MIDDVNAHLLLWEYKLSNYKLDISLQYYTVTPCRSVDHDRTVWTYGGFAIFTALYSLWWLFNTFQLNAKDATLFHRIVTIIPVLKFVEMLSRYYFWNNFCSTADTDHSTSTMLYGELYETSFYALVFSLSNGLNLTRKSF